MEFDIEVWLQEYTAKLFEVFGDRIEFIGLQGSYQRGEENENSDIDLVIILDKLSYDDIKLYKQLVHSMPFYDKICGFISGEEELYNWPKYDLFQLLHDTLPLHGDLKKLIPSITQQDIREAIKINSANLYHKMCNGFLFSSDDAELLYEGYKIAYFILCAINYLQNGSFAGSKRELLYDLEGEDKEILLVSLNWQTLNVTDNLDFYFEKIINWASSNII